MGGCVKHFEFIQFQCRFQATGAVIKPVQNEIQGKCQQSVVDHQHGYLIAGYVHVEVHPKQQVGQKKREEAQGVDVENHQRDEKRVQEGQTGIVQGENLRKAQMFAPDENDERYADQEGRQGFGKEQQISKGIRIGKVEDRQCNGDAEDGIGKVVQARGAGAPVPDARVVGAVTVQLVTHNE